MNFNRNEMAAMRPGTETELALPNATRHDVVIDQVQDHGDDITSIVGHIKGRGHHNRVIITTGPNGSYARFSTPEGEYRLVPGDGHDWLVDMTAERPFIVDERSLENDGLVPSGPMPKADTSGMATFAERIPGLNVPFTAKVTPTPQAVVDLLIVYTNGLAQNLGPNLLTRLNFLVQSANTAYADSEIAITLRLVRATMVNYTDANGNDVALYNATPSCGGSCTSPFDPVFAGVEAIRTSVGADIVAILRNGSTFGGSGIAWVGGYNGGAYSSNFMYSVTTGCTAGCENVFIHELGHNMGNMHDRRTVAYQQGGTATLPPGAFNYSFGYPHCASGAFSCNSALLNNSGGGSCTALPECSTSNVNNFSDIMSYFFNTTDTVYKFSNTTVTCQAAGGNDGPHACGSATEDTALSMNNRRVDISAIRSTVVGGLPGAIQFSAPTYNGTEGASVQLTVRRIGGSSGTVQVSYATANGSALSGSDYTTTNGTLTWGNGVTADQFINVPILTDALTESGETFTVTLSNPTGTTGVFLGYPTVATVFIAGAPWPPGGTMPAGWTTTGGAPWTVVTDSVYDATTALRSHNVVGPGDFVTFANSDLSTPSTGFSAGNVVFAYKVSSYPGYGILDFMIDGVVAFTSSNTHTVVSPDSTNWAIASVPITAGNHVLTWRFKNSLPFPCAGASPPPPAGVNCATRAWIDAVTLPLAIAAPTVGLTSSANPSTLGQLVTLTSAVTGSAGTATGTVNFRNAGVSLPGCAAVALSAGSSTCSTNALANGAHALTAVYSGDSNYSGGTSSTVNQNVSGKRKKADFNSDARGDLAWKHSGGNQALWAMNGNVLSAAAYVSAGAGTVIRRIADFNGDGYSDILFRGSDGSYHTRLMQGLASTGGATIYPGGTGWENIGLGDFNGDGAIDLLWKQTPSGSYGVWLMGNGAVPSGYGVIFYGGDGLDIKLVGDFNGDGKSDFVGQYPDGSWRLWLMDGMAGFAAATLIGAGTGLDWNAVAVGDFNGDGRSDLLWRNSAGSYGVWTMNGITPMQTNYIFWGGTGLELLLVADFNNDGKSDLVGKYPDGTVRLWLMDGLVGWAAVDLASAGNLWTPVHSDDFNNDGFADLLWKHTDGSYRTTLHSGLSVIGVPTQVLGPASGWDMAP